MCEYVWANVCWVCMHQKISKILVSVRIKVWTFPVKWCYNRLIVLFKKGARMCCGNYRGISIGDTMGKLYAKILGSRLKRWMNIDNCQAGGQEERGCIEHILTLRLIIYYAIKEKVKLFILFVDFSKAYDKVPGK